jgi:RHS repeat-associated protein
MTDTATYYYAVDPTGSVIGLAEYDGTASVVNHYRYDVWGMPQGTETEGVDNPIRFKSRWWDPDTKLLDFRSRWYDPEIGRFISEDPIGLAGGINVYVFAGNNPVAGQDPFGLSSQETPRISTATGPDGCAVYVQSPVYTGCRVYYVEPLVVSGGYTWGTVFDPWYIGPDPDYSPGPGQVPGGKTGPNSRPAGSGGGGTGDAGPDGGTGQDSGLLDLCTRAKLHLGAQAALDLWTVGSVLGLASAGVQLGVRALSGTLGAAGRSASVFVGREAERAVARRGVTVVGHNSITSDPLKPDASPVQMMIPGLASVKRFEVVQRVCRAN